MKGILRIILFFRKIIVCKFYTLRYERAQNLDQSWIFGCLQVTLPRGFQKLSQKGHMKAVQPSKISLHNSSSPVVCVKIWMFNLFTRNLKIKNNVLILYWEGTELALPHFQLIFPTGIKFARLLVIKFEQGYLKAYAGYTAKFFWLSFVG